MMKELYAAPEAELLRFEPAQAIALGDIEEELNGSEFGQLD